MKRIAHSLAWYLYWLSALLLALLATLMITAKVVFEDIDSYRMDIQKHLSDQLQAKVHLGKLQGSWQGWKPALEIKSFSITELNDAPGLEVGLLQANLEVDPAASLKVLEPVFSKFEFDGLKVRYDLTKADQQQNADIANVLPQNTHPVSDAGADLLTLLLHQSDIDLSGTRVEVVSKTGEEIAIAPIHLRMQHDGVMHQLLVSADLETEKGQAAVNFAAEVLGNPSRNPVDFYLNVEGLDQNILNPWLRLADLELETYQASQQIWGRANNGKLIFLTGKTRVNNFKFREYELDEFSLHTALVRRDRSYQLQVTDLYVAGAEKKLSLPTISLDLVRAGNSIQPKSLMVDQLDLSAAHNWLIQQPFVPENAVDIIKTFAPQGNVENILVSWGEDEELQNFKLSADLREVGINAWDDVPELKGINGLLSADASGGKIHLKSQDFTMHYPTLFTDRWQYSSADGVIGWRFEDKGVVVASELLHLADEYVSASGRFSIYLPYSRDEQPLLNLQIGMKSSEGTQARYYIPPKEVGEKTYEWLVEAIKEGHIKQAGFVLNGVTRARLPDYQLPVVQMFFDLEGATFAYQPGWPAIKQSDAFIFFRNGELLAEATGGYIYDSEIEHAWVHLPQTTDKLFVNGSVKGQATDIYKLLTESALKEEVGDDLAAWKMSGNVSTQLELNIPLYTARQPMVQVNTSLTDARFESEEDKLHFSEITGIVSYDSSSGLQSEALKARLFNQPVAARITSSKKKTQVYIDSAIESERLKEWLDLELLNLAKGKIKYQARLDMCPGKACNQLVIGSDLQGVEIDAPAPLSKVAAQKGHLSVVSDLGRGYKDERSAVRLNLGNQLRGIMVTKGQSIERARFSLGGLRPQVPNTPGIWLDGEIDYLDYDDLDRFMTKAGFSEEKPKNTSQEQEASLLKSIDLKIGQFVFNDIQLNQLNTQLMPGEKGWNLNVSGPEVAGSLFMPEASNVPYYANLDYLNVTTKDDEEELEEVFAEEPVNAKELPLLDFTVKEFTLNNKPMGQLSFNLLPIVNGIVVENIKVKLFEAVANGEIRWRSENDQRSYLTLRLDSDDFGKVLEAWGISKSLETKSLKSYVQLNWDGAPWEFDIANADGEVQFAAKDGRLIDVGNAGNFLRVFGILNLQSLGRRLRLDFSDLFETGVAFDEMNANYAIDNGIATTTEPFVMVGPSVNMALQGSLDLENETVDKDIEVAIPVTGNIPLVSVLLGAPQVAGAVFLLDKLIGDPLAKFSTVKYHMSGDWGDPEIKIYSDKDKTPSQEQTSDLNDG